MPVNTAKTVIFTNTCPPHNKILREQNTKNNCGKLGKMKEINKVLKVVKKKMNIIELFAKSRRKSGGLHRIPMLIYGRQ